jgi:hypothetical protein
MSENNAAPLEKVFEKVLDEDGDVFTVGDMLSHFEDRSFGPIFTLLALFAILPPMGAIPGIPTAIAAVILLFSLQIILGRSYVWIPGFIKNIKVKRKKIEATYQKSNETLDRVDGLINRRMLWMTGAVSRYIAAIIISLLALAMVPLEVIPFAVALPGAAIAVMGIALMARDGLLVLFSYTVAAVALIMVVLYSPFLSWVGLR